MRRPSTRKGPVRQIGSRQVRRHHGVHRKTGGRDACGRVGRIHAAADPDGIVTTRGVEHRVVGLRTLEDGVGRSGQTEISDEIAHL